MSRASKFAQDFPQQVTIDGVESLCMVDEGNKKVTMLFPTFFLKKSRNENHISGAPRATKATLRFRNHCVNDVCQTVLFKFKYVLSTMGVSKESISKFLIGNRFHVKLRILSPENCKQSLQVKS